MKNAPQPTVFLGPQGVHKHFSEHNLAERKDTCDMAFIGGTLIITPHVISGATRLQQWIQRYFYLRKPPRISLLRTASRQLYTIHYQPDSLTLNFLKNLVNLPIRFTYFWPLEAAQQILRKHIQVLWSLLWLPTPLGPISLFVYYKDRPLFCRTLPADALLNAEIIPTQQYLKRFGYEKNTLLHIFTPTPLTQQVLDTSLTFSVYTPPIITRPTAPLFIQELSRNYWLAQFPLASQWLLIMCIFLGSYGVGTEAWELSKLYSQQQQLQAIMSPLLSPAEKELLETLAPYGAFWKIVSPTIPLVDHRLEISEKLKGKTLPQEISWCSHPLENILVLEFDAGLSKTQKILLTDTFKALSSVIAISWKKTQLHLRLLQHDNY